MVSVVEEEPHPEDSVNFLQPAKLYESDYSSGEDNTAAVIENSVEKNRTTQHAHQDRQY